MDAIKKHKNYNDFINKCEVAMAKEPAVFPVTHKFCEGMYRREMFIPKGGILSSLIHLEDNFFEVVAGVIDVLTEDGAVRYLAPADGISKAGCRKLGYALEDTIFITYHPNPDNCQDISILEERLFKTYDNPLLTDIKLEVVK